ncbi:MAG: hypothetical protein EOL93_09310 [Epsilonproteobacteria bacterium]|nr:hypothetical protein [Campylobacterota bacterium]
MKKHFLFLLIAMAVIFSSCEDKLTYEYMANCPVYMSYETLRTAIVQTPSQPISKAGKIYIKDNYLFIIQELQGIHIIDNNNPEYPENISFIAIPGATDMAVKDHILYVDSYIDMIAFDVSHPEVVTIKSRIKEVLPYTLPPWDLDYPVAPIHPDSGVVTGWEKRMVKEEFNQYPYPVYTCGTGLEGDLIHSSVAANGNGITSSGTGSGGAITRFRILDNTLYSVNENKLGIFNITDVENPVFRTHFYPGWGIETLFIFDEKAFFGKQTGMSIFSLANRYAPEYIGEFQHATGCDPVIVKDTLAYLTLRGGNACGNEVNELQIITISEPSAPKLLASYPMSEPYGLGIFEKTLFVCDGEAGLKIFSIDDPMHLDEHQLAHFEHIHAYDVIPLGELVIMIGEEGLYQFTFTYPETIELLSILPIGQ